MKEMTRRRRRRTSTSSVRKSVCFHAIPASSSCMQTALGTTSGLPSWSLTRPSKYVMSPTQSQPSVSGFASQPIPSSPWSKTFLNRCVGAGSP